MKILAVSDEEAKILYDYYRPGVLSGYDVILSCGDLKRAYLEFLVTMSNTPLVYVRGNHDDRLVADPPTGCVCADGDVVKVNGLRIMGLGGAYKYRPGLNMYTERQMERRAEKLRFKAWRAGGVDIILTHAPPRHINDLDDMAHRGFECFTYLMEKYEPSYLVHGHIHLNYGMNLPRQTRYRRTNVVNAFEKFEIEL